MWEGREGVRARRSWRLLNRVTNTEKDAGRITEHNCWWWQFCHYVAAVFFVLFLFFFCCTFSCKMQPGSCRGVDPTRLTVVVPNHTLLALPQASWDLVSQFSASSLTLICNISCAPFIINLPRCVVCCSSCMNWWPHCFLPRGGLNGESDAHMLRVCVRVCEIVWSPLTSER